MKYLVLTENKMKEENLCPAINIDYMARLKKLKISEYLLKKKNLCCDHLRLVELCPRTAFYNI